MDTLEHKKIMRRVSKEIDGECIYIEKRRKKLLGQIAGTLEDSGLQLLDRETFKTFIQNKVKSFLNNYYLVVLQKLIKINKQIIIRNSLKLARVKLL